MVSSHIKMPKCVLRQFEDENHFVYFFNLKEGWIQNSHAESINTEKGYFSQKIENFLSDNIETPIGHILKFVKGIDYMAPEFVIDNSTKVAIKKYAFALFARSQMMLKKFSQASVFAQFLSNQSLHDITAIMGIAEASKQHWFEDWEITFLSNQTDSPFVLPICGMYCFRYNNDILLNIPITPHYAITFMPKSAVHKYMQNGKMRLFQVIDSGQAMQFNMLAVHSEQQNSNYGIASNSKSTLEELSKHYFSNRNK